MTRIITYSCDNPECHRVHFNPNKCPSCGCEDNSIYEDYEEEATSGEDNES